MTIFKKLLDDSYNLQDAEPEKRAYWHLQKLREKLKELIDDDYERLIRENTQLKQEVERLKHIEQDTDDAVIGGTLI